MNKRDFSLRKKVIERDSFTCQKCKTRDPSGKDLEAHHISLLVMGGSDTLDNLITLCRNCHHFAPNDLKEFREYVSYEMDGTSTTLIKAWQKVRKENPELFDDKPISER